jgi:uncharacterized protein
MELSNTPGQSTAPSNSLLQMMRRHPLSFYFLMAFGFTWIYELLVFALLHLPLLPWGVPLAIVGPTLAAFLMTSVIEGRSGVLHLLRRYARWHVGVQWYLFALLGIPAVVLLSVLVLPGGITALRAPTPALVLSYLASYIGIFLVGGPLFEEPGWRGFALPRLQQRAGPLVGSLLLGVLWGLWHLPLFLFVPGYDGAGSGFVGISIPFVEFVISIVAGTCIITWVFNNTRGSLLLTMLLHASFNTASGYAPATPLVILSRTLCFVVVALVIIAATRGRLSYQRETALSGPRTDREQEPGTAGTSV